MEGIEKNPLRLTRAGVTMAVWGLLLLLAGVYFQYGSFPTFEASVYFWIPITLIGLAVQALCEIKHQPVNFYVWLGSIAVAWGFTYFVNLWPGGAHFDLYGDLAGIWLIFLGIGYIDTARKIDTRFLWIGVVHLVAGALFELSARGIVKLEFLDKNAALIFGLVAGGTLIVAGVMSRIPAASPQIDSALPSQSAV